jgi:holo-[acyl-carrier protein] synthase
MIGVDIVSINRIENMINKFGQKALKRFLSNKEILLIKNLSTVAGFWAAKEAASKAIKTGISKTCTFHDIKISKNKNNAPKIKYSKKIRKKFKIKKTHISISHDNGFAIAIVQNQSKIK